MSSDTRGPAPEPKDWLALGAHTNRELKGPGADKVRGRSAVNEFCDWAINKGLAFPAPIEVNEDIIAEFTASLEHHRTAGNELNKAGQSAVQWAYELMRRSRHPHETLTTVTGAVEAAAKELPMPKKPKDVEPDEVETDEDEDEGDDDEGDNEEEFAEAEAEPEPEKKRRNVGRQQQQPIIVQLPPQRGSGSRAGNRGAPPRSATSKLFAQTAKVRFFKRDERGKRVMVEDYDLNDIGKMNLEEFAEQVVHPRFANEQGNTEYLVFEVNPTTDEVRGHGTSFTIEGDEQPERGGADPFRTVHQAFDLMKQLKGEPDEAPKKDPALAALGQRAAAGGDLNQVMMVMMMEKFLNPQKQNSDNELLLKLVDRLDRMEGKGARGPENFGAPPPWYQPPLPPPPPMNGIADKMVELSMAKMLAPAPSFIDQAKDMATLRALFSPPEAANETAALRAEIQALRNASNARPKGGLEESVESFEKISTLVKTLHPTIGGEGGFAGFLKGMLTPETGKAIAAAVAGVQQAQQPQSPAAQAAGPQAPVVTTPRDPTKPPTPIPQAVREAAQGFQSAQTPPFRAERFADFIFAMYLSNDPYYLTMLEPVISELGKPEVGVNELKPARRLAMMLVAEQRPEWATPEFIDSCIAALAAKAGIPVPQVLIDTRSRWTMDFRGGIIMLDTVARPVPVLVPAPAPSPAAGPTPTPVPELLVERPPDYPVAAPRAEPLTQVSPDRKLRAIEMEQDVDMTSGEHPMPELAEQVMQDAKQVSDVANVPNVPDVQPVLDAEIIEDSIPDPAPTASMRR